MYRQWLIGTTGVLAIAILLVLKEAAPDLIASRVDPKLLMPVLLTVLAALLLSVLVHTHKLSRESHSGHFRTQTIADAISLCCAHKRVDTIDIYAISSRNIQAQLTAAKIRAKAVRVLLWEPKSVLHGHQVATEFGREVDQVIKSGWQSPTSKESFDKLEIRRYHDLPDIFYIIIDRKQYIIGLYFKNDDVDNVVDFDGVFTIINGNDISVALKAQISRHFDALWLHGHAPRVIKG